MCSFNRLIIMSTSNLIQLSSILQGLRILLIDKDAHECRERFADTTAHLYGANTVASQWARIMHRSYWELCNTNVLQQKENAKKSLRDVYTIYLPIT